MSKIAAILVSLALPALAQAGEVITCHQNGVHVNVELANPTTSVTVQSTLKSPLRGLTRVVSEATTNRFAPAQRMYFTIGLGAGESLRAFFPATAYPRSGTGILRIAGQDVSFDKCVLKRL